MIGARARDLAAGSVLIGADAHLPHTVQIECGAFSSAWRTIIRPDRRTFERELEAAGWSLFYLAGKTTATVLGSDNEKTWRRAVDRVLAQIRLQGFNCAELSAIEARSYCRVPYVTVSVHARHVQQGIVLSGSKRIAREKALSALVPAINGADYAHQEQ